MITTAQMTKHALTNVVKILVPKTQEFVVKMLNAIRNYTELFVFVKMVTLEMLRQPALKVCLFSLWSFSKTNFF